MAQLVAHLAHHLPDHDGVDDTGSAGIADAATDPRERLDELVATAQHQRQWFHECGGA